jgi:hypothetical protein
VVIPGTRNTALSGRELYNGNVTLKFGRFQRAFRLRRCRGASSAQKGPVGAIGESGLVDRVILLTDAVRPYEVFEMGIYGKVVVDPWT